MTKLSKVKVKADLRFALFPFFFFWGGGGIGAMLKKFADTGGGR